MKTLLLNIWDRLRSSYWFVPSLFFVVTLLLSIFFPILDREFSLTLPDWGRIDTLSARTLLSTIAAAMIGVTGTVFSITIVTLSLASQQFGPRLLRTFMEDTLTVFTLSIFLSTGLYSLLVLRVIREIPDHTDIPSISVLFAIFLALLSVLTLIVFIHHM
ncbi:DUF2254 domain-containing protein [bacterium]|nr:DUF2254 domain-containing protein [bacterium]